MDKSLPIYDVVIIGGGVSGASQLYALTKYTNHGRVALFEKEPSFGLINSNKINNSQTLHEGEIETNYNFEKAKQIKYKAYFTRKYVIQKNVNGLFLSGGRMVLGIGDVEVDFLENRFNQFKELFPALQKLYRKDLETIEPKIVEGRNKNENIIALYNKDGLTIDYGLMAKELVEDAKKLGNSKIEVYPNSGIDTIEKMSDGRFLIKARGEYLIAKFVSICAGAHSMYFAKKLGLKKVKNTSLLCVAGNFYYTYKTLNNKVYTLQDPKLPFSAVHGDPDIIDQSKTRYGPTTRIVFQLERRRLNTIKDFFVTLSPFFKTLLTYIKIMYDKKFFLYALKHNLLFQLPVIGTYLFTKEIQKIIPTATLNDVTHAKDQGGVRPQIVNVQSDKPLNLGEAKLEDTNLLINVTPSPGATTSIYNGLVDVRKIAKTLNFDFHEDKILKDFNIDKLI